VNLADCSPADGTVTSGDVLFGADCDRAPGALLSQDLLEEAGIEVPQTLDELAAAVEALHDRITACTHRPAGSARGVTQFSIPL